MAALPDYGLLQVVPFGVDIATTEKLPINLDSTPQLQPGWSPSSPSSIVRDEAGGADIIPVDAPTVTGNIITQVVDGSVLTKGHTYALIVTYVAASDTVQTMIQRLSCRS